MDRKLAFIVAILSIIMLFSAAAALAQGGQGKDVVLGHSWQQGDTVRYKITQDLSGSRTLPGAQQSTAIACQMVSTIRIRFVKALPNNAMEIAAETESATLKLPNRDPRPFAASKEPRIYRIDFSGKAVQAKDAKDQPKASSRSVLDNAWLEPMVILSVFPETGLKTDAGTPCDVPNPLLAGGEAVRVSMKLGEVKQSRDGWIANVAETVGLPDDQSADNPDSPGTRIEGQVSIRFLADKGRLFSAEGNLKTSVRSETSVPGLPGGDQPMGAATSVKVEQLATKFTIETLPPAPAPSGRK